MRQVKIYLCLSIFSIVLMIKAFSLQRQALKLGQLVQCSTCLVAKMLTVARCTCVRLPAGLAQYWC